MTVRFHDSAHPLFQTTDTFQQLIQDLNHFGDIHDSDMKYLDSAIGPGGTLSLNGLGDFTANTIVDALNELDSDLHGVGGGNFKADTNTAYKTVTDAINEIERVFDASSGEILYPTGDPTETQNRLLISTAQSGGQRIELRAGHNIFLDAVNDVIIDAGGANITFKDDSAIRFDFQMGANQEIDVPTGNLTVDVAGDITLDAGGADIDMQVATVSRVKHSLGATNTVTVNGNYTVDVAGNVVIDTSTGSLSLKDDGANAIVYSLDPAGTNTATVTGNLTYDVSGDITLDANGDDFIFKDGTTERFRLNADAAPNMTITGTAASITNTAGDFTINAYQSFVLNTNAGTKSWDIDTDTITHTGDAILDVSGDITLDADGGDVYLKDGGTTNYQFATNGTISRTGDLIFDISGDITLDADGNDIVFKNGAGADQVTHTLADNADYSVTYPSNVTHTQSAGSLTFDIPGDITLDADGADIFFKDAGTTRIQHTMGATNTVAVTGNYTLDVSGDIALDADGGDVFLKDAGTQFAAFTNTSGNLILKSGTTTAMTFSGANVTVAGSITMPSSGTGSPITTTKTVDGALSDINSRIPNVYDRNGILLNPLP